jgi:hypothetical protein
LSNWEIEQLETGKTGGRIIFRGPAPQSHTPQILNFQSHNYHSHNYQFFPGPALHGIAIIANIRPSSWGTPVAGFVQRREA